MATPLTPQDPPGTRWAISRAGPFLTAAVLFGGLVAYLWFLTDDAFISFRYARNWAEGLGLRFNPGAGNPVEGYSNFLWTALMAWLHLLSLDMIRLSCWISAALGVLLLWLLYRSLRDDLRVRPVAAFLGLLVAALSPAFAAWSTGGLETMLFALLFFLVFRNLLIRPEGPRPLASGLAAGLMALTRPEGIVWAFVLLGLFLLFRPKREKGGVWRGAAVYLAGVLVLFVPYFAARFAYFGFPMPNTYYAKSVMGLLTLERGFNYTMSYLLCFVTPLVLTLSAPLFLRRDTPPAARHACLAALGFLGYAVLSGGDFMAFGRFMAPATPYFAMMAAWLLHRYLPPTTRAGPAPAVAAIVVILVQVLPAFDLSPCPESLRRLFHFRWNSRMVKTEQEQWRQMNDNLVELTMIGKVLKEISGRGDTFVGAAIGAVGYYSDLTVYDQCGLVNPDGAQKVVERPVPRAAGHDKYVEPEYFLDRDPTFLRAVVVSAKKKKQAEDDMERALAPGYLVYSLRVPPRLAGGMGRLYVVFQRRMTRDGERDTENEK